MIAPTTAVPCPVSEDAVERAVAALLKWKARKNETLKPQLLEQDEFLYLILTLKKIPARTQKKAIKIPVPHPLYDPVNDGSELCLIYDDRSNSSLTKDVVKQKVEKENIPISKVLKLSKLKSDFRPFEAKRKLCDSYDLFLADKRVIPLLPKMLGKHFFKKRRIPVPVNLESQNWKERVELVCRSAMLYLRTGTCCVLKVGKASMSKQHLVENVIAAICGAIGAIPRKWGNVRALHLKLSDSLALPVYQTLPDVRLKIECAKDEINEEEVKPVAGILETSRKSKKKGRISDVMYLEDDKTSLVTASNIEFDDANGSTDEPGTKKRKKKTDSIATKKRNRRVHV